MRGVCEMDGMDDVLWAGFRTIQQGPIVKTPVFFSRSLWCLFYILYYTLSYVGGP